MERNILMSIAPSLGTKHPAVARSAREDSRAAMQGARTRGIGLPAFAAAAAIGAVLVGRAALRRHRRFDFRGAGVLITGGSRGLGLEMARLLGDEGARLVLLARDEGELQRAQDELQRRGATVYTYRCDLRDEDDIERTIAAVHAEAGPIDVLVNNAGIIRVGPFETMDQAAFEESLAVHTRAPLKLVQLLAPDMRRRRNGRIVNISSICGLVSVPHLAPYVTSKFALTGLSQTLRAEFATDDVLVTTVCPGLVRTGSHVNARFRGQQEKEFAWFAASSGLPLFSTSAPHAARRIVNACRHGQARLTITPQAKLLHAADTVAPGLAQAILGVVSRLLPYARIAAVSEKPGWAVPSRWAPSWLTRAADRAIERNNELTPSERATYERGHTDLHPSQH